MKSPVCKLAAIRAAAVTVGIVAAYGLPGSAYGASNTPFAAPTQTAVPGSAGGMLRVVLALILVLAAVLVTAWFARRLRGLGAAGHVGIEVLAQVSLGARERAVLLRVCDRQLLVGVAPGSVRTLHVLEELAPAAPANAAAADAADEHAQRPSFKSMLLRSLGK